MHCGTHHAADTGDGIGVTKSPLVRAAVTLAGGSLKVSVVVKAAETEPGHSTGQKMWLEHSQKGS